MSGNDNMDEMTKKASGLSLNVKAKEFKPTFNVKAPSFVPKTFGAKKPAEPAPEPAPKAMSISIGGAKPKAPETAPVAEEKAPTPVAEEKAPAPKSAVPSPTPKDVEPASEELEVEEEMLLDEHFKEHFNVIFIGHVDAGKSTLGGNILFLTGMVDKRTMEKYERDAKEAGRESWYLSWALDTNNEERAKGKTVECGRAFFETTKRRYTILDAPGHKNYVPSMLGGAAQADVGVLVISARKGEFETGFDRGGQTREHAILAKTAGVRRLIVAVNKMDDPTVEWSKERYDEILGKLTPFMKNAGYNPKTDIIFLPISGYTGAGVKERVGSACEWYSGPSLLETLDDMQAVERKINGPLRMPISEKYREMGTIVSGKIESGHVKVNQKAMLLPEKRLVEISAIYGENDSEEQSAVSGDNIRLRLRGVEEEDIQPGFVLTDTKHPCRTTRTFDAQLIILDVKNIITAGYKSVLHVHTAIEEVSLVQLLHTLDKRGRKSRVPPRFLKKGQACIARIEASQSLCIERFKDFPQLGRFTLRDEGKTIAIGKIVKLVDTVETNGN